MTVLSLTDCPPNLRGDLTKWLLEIDSGVFVGHISARVRDALWQRVKDTSHNGRAILVFSTNGEQRLDFRVHGALWEPIDFDGIKLMLRPGAARLKARQPTVKHGFSDAAKRQTAQRFSKIKSRRPDSYVVIDLETTGLDPDADEILEFGAIKIISQEATDRFQSLVFINRSIPESIAKLTGITEQAMAEEGRTLSDTLPAFLAFIGNIPLVAHNVNFDVKFLLNACVKCGLPLLTNRCIDTLTLARRLIHGLPDYKLGTLSNYFSIEVKDAHRSMDDCEVTARLYKKLMNLIDG